MPHKKEKSLEVQSQKINVFLQQKKVIQVARIIYDDRILRWFNPEFTATITNQFSIAYHRINPFNRSFLLKIGNKKLVEKKSLQGFDSVYSLKKSY